MVDTPLMALGELRRTAEDIVIGNGRPNLRWVYSQSGLAVVEAI